MFKADLNRLQPDKRLAYGWFNVMSKDGKLVEDKQGDVIKPETVADAARTFIEKSREGHFRHEGRKIASVVESLVFTKEIQEILDIDLGLEGWFGGLKFHDDECWELVKKGETLGLSIGGKTHYKETGTQ